MPSEELVKLSLFGLSNIAADSVYSATMILTEDSLVYRLLFLLNHKTWPIRRECAFVFVNSINGADEQELRKFHTAYSKDYISRLLSFLDSLADVQDASLIKDLLRAFSRLLNMDT